MEVVRTGSGRPGINRTDSDRIRHPGRRRFRWPAAAALLLAALFPVALLLGACNGTSEDPAGSAPQVITLVFVSATGSDADPGTPGLPMATLPAAIAAAAAQITAGYADVAEVLVSEGAYMVDSTAGTGTHVVLSEGVSLFGGYSPTNWLAVRDPVAHPTTIADLSGDAGTSSVPKSPLVAPAGITRATRVDGFQIYGSSSGTVGYSAGAYLAGSPTLSGNVIYAGTGTTAAYGVYVQNADPLLSGNDLHGSTSTNTYGIYVNLGAPRLAGNTIEGGAGTASSYGVYTFNASPELDGNTIDGGASTNNSAGVLNSNGNPQIVNNTISGGSGGASTSTAVSTYSTALGGPIIRNNVIDGGNANNSVGILIDAKSQPAFTPPDVQNNTISGGSAGTFSYAIQLKAGGYGTIENNIVFTAGGTNRYCVWELADNGGAGTLHNNDLFDCAQALYADYVGSGGNCPSDAFRNCYSLVSDLNDAARTTQGAVDTASGNVADTPVFVGASDWHLTVGTSTSISDGGLDLTAVVPTDKDGVTRTPPVSMGAYEY